MNLRYRFLACLAIACLWMAPSVLAQGVTSASLNGLVVDETGESLPGANVVAVHEPSGTQYGVSTRSDGRFAFPSVRVGGPYTVTVTFVGYESVRKTGLQLRLGQERSLEFTLSPKTEEMDEVVVSGESDPNADRAGAATAVNQEQIDALPTISRSTQDFTRLTPQSDGLSFGGRNTQYNNFSVDGSIFNNPYGLDSPVPGGQTNAQPVSLDAVEQVQVSIAPFDVREGGFTGAGVNTVTKSGTNEFKGTAYYFTRNENFIGDQVADTKLFESDLSFGQYGASLGGPIIEDKLFFFTNVEIVRRDDPGSTFRAAAPGVSGANVSRVEASTMDAIRDRLIDEFGYDPGTYGEGYKLATENEKFLAKLDYNISPGNTASLRFNYLNAARDLNANPVAFFQRGPSTTALPFSNSGYTINNKIYSIVGETNLTIGNRFANKTIVGFTAFRDSRDAFSPRPFPTVEIAQDGQNYTTAGFEPFSVNNLLDQDVIQFTNNLSIFAGTHTITAGVNYEQFIFNNSFNLFAYGNFAAPAQVGGTRFLSIDDFFDYTDPALAGTRPCLDDDGNLIQYPNDPAIGSDGFVENRNACYLDLNGFADRASGDFALDETNVAQAALYVQDEYRPTEDLKLTAGLRVDLPLYYMDIPTNQAIADLTFRNGQRLDTGDLPDVAPLLSPRLGVNWDVFGDRSTQVRGGTGIFTGRLPFVWIGNQVTNQGFDAPGCTGDGCLGIVNGLDEDFTWPQVWKTNLAVDQRLPGGVIATAEFLYSNDINAVIAKNINLPNSTGTSTLDGRPVFGNATGDPTAVNSRVQGAYVLDNSDEGYEVTFTGELKKSFDFGLDAQASYTYTKAKNKLTSTEIAQVLFQGNPIAGDPNNPGLGFSEFGLKHRFVAAANYRFDYDFGGSGVATTIGMFAEIAKGDRFSYIYGGDFNGDGVGNNDLLYIPENPASEMTFAPTSSMTPSEQAAAFDAYIAQDDYLSENRGSIAERNGALSPWYFSMDLRVAQEFRLNVGDTPNRVRVSLDILNVPNLLNSDWGVRETVQSNAPVSVVDNDANGPVFQYVGTNKTFQPNPILDSRWRMQLGVRYIFN
ncbi:TonB-dependent receptor [Longibacter salinarum]|uniref:TonB-dependent receptor n=1 Tax=Longibacter salinarum TaxID=1850348 RepID=A0A2A8CXN6_9BACT|nr:TonB-dependent receptor [Longibacter salinarum]PEN13138.1 TonB-dependent receptor [Longibacter salinarum]